MKLFVYIGSVWIADKEIALQNALRYNVHCRLVHVVINEEMQNKVGLFFSEQ